MALVTISLEELTEIEKHMQLESDLNTGSDFDELYLHKVNLLKQTLKENQTDESTDTTDESTDEEIPEDDGGESIDGESTDPPEGESTEGSETTGDETSTDSADENTDENNGQSDNSASEDTEPAGDEAVAKECLSTLHSLNAIRQLSARLHTGFSVEDISEYQFQREIEDDLTYLTNSTSKISQVMTDYIRGRFATYNQYLEKINRAREIVVLNKKITDVNTPTTDSDTEADVTTDAVVEAETELEVGEDIDIKATYRNEVFVSQLKINDQLDFDKNIVIATSFLKKSITTYSVSLSRSIEKIRNNIASSSDTGKDGCSLSIPSFEGLEKTELKGYEAPSGLCSLAYQDMLPGDIVFITYVPSGKNPSVESLEKCASLFGVNTKTLASVRFAPLLQDRDRLIAYLDALEDIVRFGKSALKYIYELSTDKLMELSRALGNFKKVYDSQYVQTTIRDSLSLRLITQSDYVGRYIILSLMLLHDYISRVTEASLDYIRESLTEQDK